MFQFVPFNNAVPVQIMYMWRRLQAHYYSFFSLLIIKTKHTDCDRSVVHQLCPCKKIEKYMKNCIHSFKSTDTRKTKFLSCYNRNDTYLLFVSCSRLFIEYFKD